MKIWHERHIRRAYIRHLFHTTGLLSVLCRGFTPIESFQVSFSPNSNDNLADFSIERQLCVSRSNWIPFFHTFSSQITVPHDLIYFWPISFVNVLRFIGLNAGKIWQLHQLIVIDSNWYWLMLVIATGGFQFTLGVIYFSTVIFQNFHTFPSIIWCRTPDTYSRIERENLLFQVKKSLHHKNCHLPLAFHWIVQFSGDLLLAVAILCAYTPQCTTRWAVITISLSSHLSNYER